MRFEYLSDATLEARASETRLEACKKGCQLKWPLEVEILLEQSLGYSVCHGAELPSGVDGWTDPDRKEVLVSDQVQHRGRERFTLAHEVGHIVLHEAFLRAKLAQPQLIPFPIEFYRDPRLETQAHRFAASLLMPKNELVTMVEAYARQGSAVSANDVAHAFGTSIKASEIRLTRLGLLLNHHPGDPMM